MPMHLAIVCYSYLTLLGFHHFIMCIIEASLIHSLETLTLTDIDHVSIRKYSVSPTQKRGGITRQIDPKHASVHGNLTPPDPYVGSVGSKTRRYKETHTRHAGQSHLMRVT